MNKEFFTLETTNDEGGRRLSKHLHELGINHYWNSNGIEEQGAPLPRLYTGPNTFYGERAVWGFIINHFPEKFGLTKEDLQKEYD